MPLHLAPSPTIALTPSRPCPCPALDVIDALELAIVVVRLLVVVARAILAIVPALALALASKAVLVVRLLVVLARAILAIVVALALALALQSRPPLSI